MAEAAALPVHNAVIARLASQCPSCPKWYSSRKQAEAAQLPYGLITFNNEAGSGFLGHGGSDLRATLTWFSDDRDDTAGEKGAAPILRIWAEVFRALKGVKLTVAGHTQLVGNVELIDTFRDPEGYQNAVAHYTAQTVTA